MNPTWKMLHPKMTLDHLGLLPVFLDTSNPAPAKEQLHKNYSHGGGWSPFTGFHLNTEEYFWLEYPDDPPLQPLAETYLREEHILFYECAWVAIIQPNGAWEVARMD